MKKKIPGSAKNIYATFISKPVLIPHIPKNGDMDETVNLNDDSEMEDETTSMGENVESPNVEETQRNNSEGESSSAALPQKRKAEKEDEILPKRQKTQNSPLQSKENVDLSERTNIDQMKGLVDTRRETTVTEAGPSNAPPSLIEIDNLTSNTPDFPDAISEQMAEEIYVLNNPELDVYEEIVQIASDDSRRTSGDDSRRTSGDSRRTSGDDSRRSSSDDSRRTSSEDSLRTSSNGDSLMPTDGESLQPSANDSHQPNANDSFQSSDFLSTTPDSLYGSADDAPGPSADDAPGPSADDAPGPSVDDSVRPSADNSLGPSVDNSLLPRTDSPQTSSSDSLAESLKVSSKSASSNDGISSHTSDSFTTPECSDVLEELHENSKNACNPTGNSRKLQNDNLKSSENDISEEMPVDNNSRRRSGPVDNISRRRSDPVDNVSRRRSGHADNKPRRRSGPDFSYKDLCRRLLQVESQRQNSDGQSQHGPANVSEPSTSRENTSIVSRERMSLIDENAPGPSRKTAYKRVPYNRTESSSSKKSYNTQLSSETKKRRLSSDSSGYRACLDTPPSSKETMNNGAKNAYRNSENSQPIRRQNRKTLSERNILSKRTPKKKAKNSSSKSENTDSAGNLSQNCPNQAPSNETSHDTEENYSASTHSELSGITEDQSQYIISGELESSSRFEPVYRPPDTGALAEMNALQEELEIPISSCEDEIGSSLFPSLQDYSRNLGTSSAIIEHNQTAEDATSRQSEFTTNFSPSAEQIHYDPIIVDQIFASSDDS